MKRTLIIAALVLALVPPVALESASAAPAATAGVSIGTVASRTAPYGKAVTVKVPRTTTRGKVVVTSAAFTIKKNGRTVRRNATSAALKAGTYSVTTAARYRTYKVVTKPETRYVDVLAVKAGTKINTSCLIEYVNEPGDVSETITVNLDCEATDRTMDHLYLQTHATSLGDGTWRVYDAWDGTTYQTLTAAESNDLVHQRVDIPVAAPEDYYSPGTVTVNVARKVLYGKTKVKTRTQKLVIRQGAKPRTCATLAEFQSVQYDFDSPELYGDSMATVAAKLHNGGKQTTYSVYDDQVIEFREYRACSSSAFMSVGFVNGYAYAKTYFG